jgi:hypothetical protein
VSQYVSAPAPWWTQRGRGETWIWAGGNQLSPLPAVIDSGGRFDLTGTRRMRDIAVLFGYTRSNQYRGGWADHE